MKSATRYLWGMLLACLMATSMVLANEIQDDVDEDGKVEVEDDSAETELKVAQVCVCRWHKFVHMYVCIQFIYIYIYMVSFISQFIVF